MAVVLPPAAVGEARRSPAGVLGLVVALVVALVLALA